MRKIKKINGFLVVKFNDREKREYEGTALGEYGVIDAEVYTGNLDIDRGAMEYDDADTLEVAVELARGLESEEDITDEPPTYTAAVETNESYSISHRQHPLPGQWPSSIIHEQEGKGKEQQNVQHRRPQDRDRRNRHRTAERGSAAAGGGQPPRPVPGAAGDGAAIL